MAQLIRSHTSPCTGAPLWAFGFLACACSSNPPVEPPDDSPPGMNPGPSTGGVSSPGAGTGGEDTAGGGTPTSGSTGGTAGTGGNNGSNGSATGGANGQPEGSGRIEDVVSVTVSGREILVNGDPIHLRGICWNPVGRGGIHPDDLDFPAFTPIDIPLMKGIGINAVRTYEPIIDRAVLDQLQEAGIFVLNSIYPWGGAPADSVVAPIEAVKDHPAILLWVIGNEWNYNGLYVEMSHAASLARLNEVAALIRSTDPSRPIATVYGELPSTQTLEAMPDVDVWGLNVYRNIGFGNLFADWAALSTKPMFLGEYGADAWNSLIDDYDPASQAHATTVLTELIVENSVLSGGISSGGTLFEWADEWWKAGNPNAHDTGGEAPGGGPYPDNVFNEEWWGIVDIDRNPRPAYEALGAIYTQLGRTPGTE